ncbi:MAG: hypothetical protein N5P05_003200 [Chroococcopsis gigantea SAG 12.99]|nr:hypothetical protein [Chroococcopsis gigantea SAG 12.99]
MENSEITSSTSGNGQRGSITVPDATSITLDNSTISTEIKKRAGESTQQHHPHLANLELEKSIRDHCQHFGRGKRGEIGLTNQQLQLENSKIKAFSSGVGGAGSISLPETENLTLMNGSEISVSTGEKGNAGSITVPVGQNISLDNSKITASTQGRAIRESST